MGPVTQVRLVLTLDFSILRPVWIGTFYSCEVPTFEMIRKITGEWQRKFLYASVWTVGLDLANPLELQLLQSHIFLEKNKHELRAHGKFPLEDPG